ncbi:hypothetical protein VOLCADRAFT_118629 [Volvox carteri f. nagariensis]|uniref:Uncharacterized protein n=1 Tax=Volvox carteri f. nagariensis TaxID=3068 RepID=D8U679_VOLCA|nr:uncharacterized protein VOLCADRAFT_118629 [Volvox carteri f. nagariensis]EFJ44806.1 hypothetical protein VOLCADRAFT_118629 [Volvox carteri f. nagariensis]|eukprot:XP_002954089.1 hypothetical protein VOLCADRAFT_118629 [Volvox carteri f. nagariensis]
MDFDDVWDDDDWTSFDQHQTSSAGRQAPSGFTTSSRAMPGLRHPPPSSGLRRQPLSKVTPNIIASRRRASQGVLPAKEALTTASGGRSEAEAEATSAADSVPRRVRPRIDQQPLPLRRDKQGQLFLPPLPAAPSPTAAAAPQSLQQPRHRTLLNYALSLFRTRLVAWKLIPPDPDGKTAAAAPGGGQVGAATKPEAAGAPVASGRSNTTLPSTADLEQLGSAVAALQGALRDCGGCNGGGGGGSASWRAGHPAAAAPVTVRDRGDVWRLCRLCMEAAYQAVQPAGSVPGVLDLSRTLQGLAGKMYDLLCELPTPGSPTGVRIQAGGVAAAAVAVAMAADDQEEEDSAAALFARVAFFVRALSTNLLIRLQGLLSSPHMPPDLVTDTALDAATKLMMVASRKLDGGGGGGGGDGDGQAGFLPSQQPLPSQHRHHHQQQKRRDVLGDMQDGLTLLADTLAFLEAVLEVGPPGLQHGAAAANGAATAAAGEQQQEEAGDAVQWRREVDPAGELGDTRRQVLTMLISGNLRLGNFEDALSYIREYERPLAEFSSGTGDGADAGKAFSRRSNELQLEVALFRLRACLGLGRPAEAAAVLAREVEPNPSCTYDIVKAAISRLLNPPSPSLEHLLTSLPAITTCLMASLARCRQAAGGGSNGAGGGGRKRSAVQQAQGGRGGVGTGGGTAAQPWPPYAGAELVLQVAKAVSCYEDLSAKSPVISVRRSTSPYITHARVLGGWGDLHLQGPIAEQQLLSLLAHDDVVAAVCDAADPRDRLHRLLFARGAAAYQQADSEAAARLFAAALLYAASGGSAPYCRTARMLSNCYVVLGQTRMAMGYLDLVEPHEPDTAALLLLRLRLVMKIQAEEAAAAAAAAAGPPRPAVCAALNGGGSEDGARSLGSGTAAAAAAAAAAAMQNDTEPLRLMDRLPQCCDFEIHHLTVAYDIATRAGRHRIAIAATQLAMRFCGTGIDSGHDAAAAVTAEAGPGAMPPRPPPSQRHPAAAAAVADLTIPLQLTRNCLVARLRADPALTASATAAATAAAAAAAAVVDDSRDGGAGGAPGTDGAALRLSYGTAMASLQDLRWLCGRLQTAETRDIASMAAEAKPTLEWLRDVALGLVYEGLGVGMELAGGGGGGSADAATECTTASEHGRDGGGCDGGGGTSLRGPLRNHLAHQRPYRVLPGPYDCMERDPELFKDRGEAQCPTVAPQRPGDWRMARTALGCARQLGAAARAAGGANGAPPSLDRCASVRDRRQAVASGGGGGGGGGGASCGDICGSEGRCDGWQLKLHTATVAVAACMLQSIAGPPDTDAGDGDGGGGGGGGGDAPAAVVESARKLLLLLQDCSNPGAKSDPRVADRPAGHHKDHHIARTSAAGQVQAAAAAAAATTVPVGASASSLRAATSQLLFVAATYLRDERGQKAALQALVEDTAVSATQLEALAELCLAPGRPWRCAPMACSLLGFAMRKALAAAPPPPSGACRSRRAEDSSVDIVARVCGHPGPSGGCFSSAVHQYDLEYVSGLQKSQQRYGSSAALAAAVASHLWASCYNAAVAEGVSSNGGSGGGHERGMSQQLLAMAVKLAGLNDDGGGGGGGASGNGGGDAGGGSGTELGRLLEQAFTVSLETLLPRPPPPAPPLPPPSPRPVAAAADVTEAHPAPRLPPPPRPPLALASSPPRKPTPPAINNNSTTATTRNNKTKNEVNNNGTVDIEAPKLNSRGRNPLGGGCTAAVAAMHMPTPPPRPPPPPSQLSSAVVKVVTSEAKEAEGGGGVPVGRAERRTPKKAAAAPALPPHLPQAPAPTQVGASAASAAPPRAVKLVRGISGAARRPLKPPAAAVPANSEMPAAARTPAALRATAAAPPLLPALAAKAAAAPPPPADADEPDPMGQQLTLPAGGANHQQRSGGGACEMAAATAPSLPGDAAGNGTDGSKRTCGAPADDDGSARCGGDNACVGGPRTVTPAAKESADSSSEPCPKQDAERGAYIGRDGQRDPVLASAEQGEVREEEEHYRREQVEGHHRELEDSHDEAIHRRDDWEPGREEVQRQEVKAAHVEQREGEGTEEGVEEAEKPHMRQGGGPPRLQPLPPPPPPQQQQKQQKQQEDEKEEQEEEEAKRSEVGADQVSWCGREELGRGGGGGSKEATVPLLDPGSQGVVTESTDDTSDGGVEGQAANPQRRSADAPGVSEQLGDEEGGPAVMAMDLGGAAEMATGEEFQEVLEEEKVEASEPATKKEEDLEVEEEMGMEEEAKKEMEEMEAAATGMMDGDSGAAIARSAKEPDDAAERGVASAGAAASDDERTARDGGDAAGLSPPERGQGAAEVPIAEGRSGSGSRAQPQSMIAAPDQPQGSPCRVNRLKLTSLMEGMEAHVCITSAPAPSELQKGEVEVVTHESGARALGVPAAAATVPPDGPAAAAAPSGTAQLAVAAPSRCETTAAMSQGLVAAPSGGQKASAPSEGPAAAAPSSCKVEGNSEVAIQTLANSEQLIACFDKPTNARKGPAPHSPRAPGGVGSRSGGAGAGASATGLLPIDRTAEPPELRVADESTSTQPPATEAPAERLLVAAAARPVPAAAAATATMAAALGADGASVATATAPAGVAGAISSGDEHQAGEQSGTLQRPHQAVGESPTADPTTPSAAAVVAAESISSFRLVLGLQSVPAGAPPSTTLPSQTGLVAGSAMAAAVVAGPVAVPVRARRPQGQADGSRSALAVALIAEVKMNAEAEEEVQVPPTGSCEGKKQASAAVLQDDVSGGEVTVAAAAVASTDARDNFGSCKPQPQTAAAEAVGAAAPALPPAPTGRPAAAAAQASVPPLRNDVDGVTALDLEKDDEEERGRSAKRARWRSPSPVLLLRRDSGPVERDGRGRGLRVPATIASVLPPLPSPLPLAVSAPALPPAAKSKSLPALQIVANCSGEVTPGNPPPRDASGAVTMEGCGKAVSIQTVVAVGAAASTAAPINNPDDRIATAAAAEDGTASAIDVASEKSAPGGGEVASGRNNAYADGVDALMLDEW